MKTAIHIALPVGLLLFSLSALAGTMECGEQIIQDGQLEGPFESGVLAACGEPTARDGNNWIYEREGQTTKVLHFNDSGQLEEISEEEPSD
jgi:hypothetical protein